MGSRLSVEERKEQLLDLALELFSEHSYEELSIDAIAEAAGVSKGLLYHYFKNKRAFFVAALERASEQLIEATDLNPPDQVPTPETMRLGMERFLAFAEEHERSYVFLLRGGLGTDPEVVAILERTRSRFLERMLGSIANAGTVEPRTRLVLRGCIALAESISLEWLHSNPRLDRDEVAELLVQVFVAAVAASA